MGLMAYIPFHYSFRRKLKKTDDVHSSKFSAIVEKNLQTTFFFTKSIDLSRKWMVCEKGEKSNRLFLQQ